MTVKDMRTYLDIKRPPVVDSAYGMADKYRISEVTARSCLRESGYYLEENATPGNGRRWVRQETQLDRIERLLEQLYQVSMKDWLPEQGRSHVEQG